MMQHCDQRCGHCAREWWKWLKSREHQMSVKLRGEQTSFSQAALTSIRAPGPLQSCHCEHPVDSERTYRGVPVRVAVNSGYVGLDGRHWVTVREGEHEPMHVPCGLLASPSRPSGSMAP